MSAAANVSRRVRTQRRVRLRAVVRIPIDRLSAQALDGLIEEFVTRDGTDYGLREATLEEKKGAVRRQLERHELMIVFDPESERCNIVPSAG